LKLEVYCGKQLETKLVTNSMFINSKFLYLLIYVGNMRRGKSCKREVDTEHSGQRLEHMKPTRSDVALIYKHVFKLKLK